MCSMSAIEVSVERLIKSCGSSNSLRQIHGQIIRRGWEQDQFVISTFLCRCSSLCHSSDYALEVFNRVVAPNTCLWNTLIKVHSACSSFSCALNSLRLMRWKGKARPDGFTFPPLIKSCAALRALRIGGGLHASVLRLGLEDDVFIGTGLIDFYGKCNDVPSAQRLFQSMKSPNVVSCTAMISGHLSHGDLTAARELFAKMEHKNAATWNAMIDGCVKSGDLQSARELFDEMPHRDHLSFTSLINGYAKVGDMASAESIFCQMPDKDLFSWSAMVSGYAQNGHPSTAIKLFLDMLHRKITPDAHVFVGLLSACSQLGCVQVARWADSLVNHFKVDLQQPHLATALVDMNAKCGDLPRARKLFDKMPQRTLIAYSSLMQGYSFHGHSSSAIALFQQLLHEGLTPDAVIFTVVLAACNYSSLVQEGKLFYNLMREKYLISPSVDHYACMVDLLARSGSLEEAHELILSMEEEPHAGVWGALLRGCCVHGAVRLGETVAAKLFLIEPGNAGNYVLLSNIYAAADRWSDVSQVRKKMRERGIKKIPGSSWI